MAKSLHAWGAPWIVSWLILKLFLDLSVIVEAIASIGDASRLG